MLFASEIKALLVSDEVSREPNPAAINDFLTPRYVPGPETMFQGIFKLPAGHWMCFSKNECRMERYWTPETKPGRYRTDGECHERSPSCGARRSLCISRAMCQWGHI